MSLYLDMWARIHKLTEEEKREWLKIASPAAGIDMEFEGMTVFDVDFAEALRNSLKET